MTVAPPLSDTGSAVAGYMSALGAATSSRWSLTGRRPASLADAATRSLSEVEPPPGLDASAILSYAARTRDLPEQSSLADDFGQPPLILYREADFFIQALVWMDGSTAIHEHRFAGAFFVLQGSSLHVSYDFDGEADPADERLMVGRLTRKTPEVLSAGSVRTIEPGSAFVHALFHLEMPSVTIVVRNDSVGSIRPQYTYRPPGLAFDGLWAEKTWSRRARSVDSLTRIDAPGGWALAEEFVDEAPLWESFRMVEHICARGGWNERSVDLAERLVRRSPRLDGALQASLHYEDAVRRILVRRGMLSQKSHRTFLALLANLTDPVDTLAIIASLHPDRPAEDVLWEWVEELSAPELRGVSGLRLPPARLAELRSSPLAGAGESLLGEIRAAWANPLQAARSVFG